MTLGILRHGLLAMSFLSAAVSAGACRAANVGRGDTMPIYLHPPLLAEAEKPTIEIAAGVGFWLPGPERFVGWAVRDLRDYLQRVSGARHPLARRDADARSGLFVGTFDEFPDFQPGPAGARQAVVSPDPEAFVVEVQGDRLFVLGRSRGGVIAAIYTLLDRVGCKWFAPGKEWENVPTGSGLTLGETLNASSAGPSYKARFFFSSYGPNSSVFRKGGREEDYTRWNLRNRMGGSAYTANAHNEEVIPASLFQTRPELFALITKGPWAAYTKGNRLPREIARGNPEAVALAVENAVKYLKTNAGKGSYYDSFSLETGDGLPACEESLAKVGNHSPTDLDFWFANQVAAGIEKAGLKDKWVGVLSYSDHAAVPSFDLHPKVAVTVTTGLDFSSKMTVEQRLDGFRSRKARRLGIYEYLSLITWSQDRPGWQPAARPFDVAANLKRWHEHGANTYMAETSDSWIDGGAGHYLAGRLMWNVDSDPKEELDAYYRGAFGPAAGEIRSLYEDWEKAPRLSRGKLARWHDWITTADRKLNGRPDYLARVNDIKRYFLYLNLIREFEIDLKHPRIATKQERYLRILRYVGSQRGEGAFHALGLFITLAFFNPPVTSAMQGVDAWGEEFKALSAYNYDEKAWRAFPPVSDAQIDVMFSAVRLPLDNVRAASKDVLDPIVTAFPADGRTPAEVRFPKLHGPPAVSRQYLLKVVAPTPKLTFEVVAGNPLGGGTEDRTCVVTDPNEKEIKSLRFKIDQPLRFELADLRPGTYTATFPEFGAEQLTVRGGNTLGAVRAPHDFWGFNPLLRTDQRTGEGRRAHFLVPAGQKSLSVRLGRGVISLGFEGGGVIAARAEGAANKPVEVPFPPSDKPRIAYVEWPAQGNVPCSEGMVVEGVTVFSPDPGHVLFEAVD